MYYTIKGKVIKGDGYGNKLGFPTVNLATNTEEFPPQGVYAGMGILENKKYKAGIVIGPNDKVEAHLIGYDGNAYGKKAVFEINKFLRDYKNFDTEKELIAQIKKDLEICSQA
ncbi:MAG: riboflavin kinase [Minisyncoccia bacterium]